MAVTEIKAEVVVLGGGPGGYSAAFRAADLGKTVVLVERHNRLGGVCLNVGCIPSKTYLHAARVLEEAQEMQKKGIEFSSPHIDTNLLRQWKDKVVTRLTMGLSSLAKQRKVQVLQGEGKFITPHQIEVIDKENKTIVQFDHAIIAVGSEPNKLKFLPNDPRIFDSTGALELQHVGGEILIIGSGIIGLEMATVYHALDSRVTLVDIADQIMPGADKDLIAPLYRRLQKQYANIYLETSTKYIDVKEDGLYVLFEGEKAPKEAVRYDAILHAVGRIPQGNNIGADKAGVAVDARGFISVDQQLRTNIAHIFAIGDVVGQPMLAHKAIPEGHVAAEVISGMNSVFNPECIPSVAYTDPEVAWVGITETQATARGIAYKKASYPWMACGRAQSIDRAEGLTKVLFDSEERIIGAGIVGVNAGEMISEMALAIELGCTAKQLAHTIHPHPTLSETMMMTAEVFEGIATDIYIKK